jgi:hypothetical protein
MATQILALDCLVVGMSLELEDHVHVRLIPRELAKNCTSESLKVYNMPH